MTKTVDIRGMPCPQPVILTRNVMQESDAMTIIVDNETTQRNVTRVVEKAGIPLTPKSPRSVYR